MWLGVLGCVAWLVLRSLRILENLKVRLRGCSQVWCGVVCGVEGPCVQPGGYCKYGLEGLVNVSW